MTTADDASNASMLSSLSPSTQPCTSSTTLKATNKQTLAERIKKNIDKKCNSDKKGHFIRQKSIQFCRKFGGNATNKNDAEIKSNASNVKVTTASVTVAPQTSVDDSHATAAIDQATTTATTTATNPNDVSNVDIEKTVAITVKKNKSSPNKSNNNNRNSGNLKLSYNNLIASLLRTKTM